MTARNKKIGITIISIFKTQLQKGRPEIFNTDQGSQFTAQEFVGTLQDRETKVNMDGSGRDADNLFVERLWRTMKYEEVDLKVYEDAIAARKPLSSYEYQKAASSIEV